MDRRRKPTFRDSAVDRRAAERADAHHVPQATNRRLSELPRRQAIVAYCRGPFCMLSDEALKLLRARGYKATKILDGVSEWQAAGCHWRSSTQEGAPMFFKQLAAKDASLSCLVGCIGHRKAIAVDVVSGDETWFVEQAAALGVTIGYVVDTHLHADHYAGGRALAARIGAPYCLHETAREVVGFSFEPLRDDQELDTGRSPDACRRAAWGHTTLFVSVGEATWIEAR